MHAANEKARMKYINFSAMAPTIMAFNATNEMVACMHLSKAGPYKRGHACDAERPNKPGWREYIELQTCSHQSQPKRFPT